MQSVGKNRTNRGAAPARRGALGGAFAGALTGVLAAVLVGGRVAAHEGDYYPDETIPEKARAIIEESTGGGSTNLIYAGIAGLVVAGAAVYLANVMRNRRTGTATSDSTGTEFGAGVATSDTDTGDGSADGGSSAD